MSDSVSQLAKLGRAVRAVVGLHAQVDALGVLHLEAGRGIDLAKSVFWYLLTLTIYHLGSNIGNEGRRAVPGEQVTWPANLSLNYMTQA